MVGLIIVAHGRLGEEFHKCAEGILGKQEGLVAVSVDFTKSVETARGELEAAIKRVDQGEGVVIMTDMFGGTPSNISLSFLDNHDTPIEVLTGVNLPMVIKGVTARKERSFEDLCSMLREYGIRGIIVASELLREREGQRS
ncbi:MAG: PTS sugar transporter subunit IIA [bacterium]|nr:PTS sugar transporter subunit IIA [bacterium]